MAQFKCVICKKWKETKCRPKTKYFCSKECAEKWADDYHEKIKKQT